LSVPLILSWSLALRKNRLGYSVAFGVIFAFTTFITYLPIVLAFFLAIYTLTRISDLKFQIVRHAAVALFAIAIFYALLYVVTGFNPIATFRTAMQLQHDALAHWQINVGFPDRHLPGTIPWDLYGFALGTGFIGYLVAGFSFIFSNRTSA